MPGVEKHLSPDGYLEYRVYQCLRCYRLWAIAAAANPVNAPEHDFYIYRNLIGTAHFAKAPLPKTGDQTLCQDTPIRVERPDVITAYLLGGNMAVDDMGGVP